MDSELKPRSKPFTRTVNAPPAWPWDQMRAARLDALHTSPVSGEDIEIILKRLEPWAFQQMGRFAAIYVRKGDVRPGEAFDVQVAGKTIKVEIPSKAKQQNELKDQILIMVTAAVMVVCLVGLVTLSLQRSQALDDQILQTQTLLNQKQREAKALSKAKDNAAALEDLNLNPDGFSLALRDLKRVSAEKVPTARIEAFIWKDGYWAVESIGDKPPVTSSKFSLQKSTSPIRRGVWMWGAKDEGR